MAEVDFSHAKIQPYSSVSNRYNPTKRSYLNIETTYLIDSNGSDVSSALVTTFITNQQKEFVMQYSGTFIASGTEFYMRNSSDTSSWRVYNISFNSGDTFIFQIKADLICQ